MRFFKLSDIAMVGSTSNPTETFTAFDFPSDGADFFTWGYDLVTESLVILSSWIVFEKLIDCIATSIFPKGW